MSWPRARACRRSVDRHRRRVWWVPDLHSFDNEGLGGFGNGSRVVKAACNVVHRDSARIRSRCTITTRRGVKILLVLAGRGLALRVHCLCYLRCAAILSSSRASRSSYERSSTVFRRERAFELSEIRNLRPAPPVHSLRRLTPIIAVALKLPWRSTIETEPYQFGVGLSEAEVMRLIKTIRSRFPIPR